LFSTFFPCELPAASLQSSNSNSNSDETSPPPAGPSLHTEPGDESAAAAAAVSAMVLIPLIRDYIDRMLHDIPGMKILVLDPETVRDLFPS
jgi:hypothetical protein